MLIHGKRGYEAGQAALVKALVDPSPSVAIVAAESLGRFGTDGEKKKALEVLLARANQETGNVYEAIPAAAALDYLGEIALTKREEIEALPRKSSKPVPRTNGYVGSLLKHILGE